MDRRELLKMIATLTGGVVIGGEVFLTGCKTNDTTIAPSFSKDDVAFLVLEQAVSRPTIINTKMQFLLFIFYILKSII